MSYRNTRGNNAANTPNSNLFNRRFTRKNDGSQDNFNNQPAYSTQAGYQQNQNQQYSTGFNNKQSTQAAAAAAVKPEYESPPPKREEYQAQGKATPNPPAQATPPAAPATTAMETAASPTDDDAKSDRPWKRKNFQKLPKKVRKKRLNAKLRNLLAPKNAMMVLHELHPGLSCATNEEVTNPGQISYSVVIEIDGKQYKGQGLSKAQAKQTACENALKSALFDKMAQSNIKLESVAQLQTQVMDTTETEAASSTNGDAGSEAAKLKKPPEEDDVPWGSLASYALFKLFSEWQSQGYALPTTPGKPVQNSRMMPMKKMPIDATQRHPVQLLNQLKPFCQYYETREGSPPNMVFNVNVTFDGQTFTGSGTNKKDAKKQCAKTALVSLGIQYTE